MSWLTGGTAAAARLAVCKGDSGHGTCQDQQYKEQTHSFFHGKTPFIEVFTVVMSSRTQRRAGFVAALFCFPKLEQPMTLLSALDDFLETTLAALPGLLRKVEYVSGLRVAGDYAHWGMARVHGEQGAREAVAQAHSMLIAEILRTPLRQLIEDAEVSSAAKEQDAADYLEALCRQPAVLLPERVGGGSTRHFSSVLHALSALARNQARATRPSA